MGRTFIRFKDFPPAAAPTPRPRGARRGFVRRRAPGVAVCAVLAAAAACTDSGPPPAPVNLFDALDTADVLSVVNGVGVKPQPGEERPPVAKPDRESVFLSFGTGVAYQLRIPARATLSTDDVRCRGSALGRLVVTWTRDGRAGRTVTRDLSVLTERAVSIGNRRSELGRLCLMSVADEEVAEPEAGMILLRPMLEAAPAAEKAVRKRRARDGSPNIVVYLVDALRADRLGCYGYQRPTSPSIDRFASDAVVFENAQSETSWTRPAVASLFTGLEPLAHGVNRKVDALPEQAMTLAERLRDGGYTTAAFVSNGNVGYFWGFAQGFDTFKFLADVDLDRPVTLSRDVHKAVVRWLDESSGEKPFFLYVHTVDPHIPYDPPEPFRSRFAADVTDPNVGSVESVLEFMSRRGNVTDEVVAALGKLYDGEVAANDASFGALLHELDARGLYEDTMVVLMSDHGEEFFDHRNWTHGKTLNAEMLDVPLIAKLPGSHPARRVRQIVQNSDVFSTVLDVAGVEPPSPVQGRSLLPLCRGDNRGEWSDVAIAHLELKNRFAKSYLDPRWKLIVRRRGKNDHFVELYDRENDRLEQRNLAEARPEVAEELEGVLDRLREEAPSTLASVELEEERQKEIEDHLRALGYLQ